MSAVLPTLEDISPTKCLDLDEKSAVNHFLGKSYLEAVKLFIDNAAHYEGYLMHMGGKAFAFYFPALFPYIKSEESELDAGVVFDLSKTIEQRLQFDPASINLAHESVLEILTYCVQNYEKFAPDPEIYGDLKGELEKLIERVKALA